jgi:hypothetical protein
VWDRLQQRVLDELAQADVVDWSRASIDAVLAIANAQDDAFAAWSGVFGDRNRVVVLGAQKPLDGAAHRPQR